MTKDDVNSLGDIVGVFEDSHIFDDNEKILFDIENIKGTRLQVISMMGGKVPEQKMYFKNSETAEFEEMVKSPKYQVGRVDGEFVDNTLKINKAISVEPK